jgi:hypothetical protein
VDNTQNCGGSTVGRLEIDDVTYTAGGSIQTFSARFEDHCNGETPALFGAISYNSTADYRTRSIAPNSLTINTDGSTPGSGSVTITNNGPSTLSPTGFSISGPNAAQFAVTGNTCTSALPAGGACTVTVRYTPSGSNAAQENATLSFFDELAPQGPPGEPDTVGTGRDIALVGNRATVSISPASANFGNQLVGDYTVPATTFTLTNHGAVTVTISNVYFVGGNYNDFNGGDTTCGFSLAAGASCTLTVYFAPTRMGSRHTTLTVYDSALGGSQSASMSGTGQEGYVIAGAAGEVGTFGAVDGYGDASNVHLAAPIVSVTTTANAAGYWLLGQDGGIFSFGDAHFYGSTGGIRLDRPVLGMSRTTDGRGYWLVASDGGIFSFGDARFYGSTGGIRLAKPIVGMAATPDSKGYWLVASDGGIFAFGDARVYGSTGGIKLDKPIVGMASTPTGHGYWLVASDGGIFAFGDARFYGSTGGIRLDKPIVGMAATPTGHGYWFVASDGGIFCFGDAPFFGSLGGQGITDVVGMAGIRPLDPYYATHSVSVTQATDRAPYGPPRRATAASK